MKVYVVKSMDSNCVASLDKIFFHQRDAEEYINEQEQKHGFVIYLLSEHPVLGDFC
ncbi:hypothetical protein [Candidatus Formimonas warabiya]|uniref:hypothetical protein n=1 Tax=Formimonas warabiya TaxID=1761012 RepID=UPI001BE3FFB2|nr:hypothetical protein [Candidatus Formimonas warabiya]